MKRPPAARYVASDAATDLMSNDTVGFDEEGEDHKEEKMIRRDDRRDKGGGITEEAIDGLQHDDEVNGQETNASHLEAPRQKRTRPSFEERLEDLQSFKAKHGHVRVTRKHDKSLGWFCKNMRAARRGTRTKGAVITEDRFKALDELGFYWGGKTKNKSFEERIEELKVFKAKHGHVRPTAKHGKSLAMFCKDMRAARRGKGTRSITDNRIKALDELGFQWGDKKA